MESNKVEQAIVVEQPADEHKCEVIYVDFTTGLGEIGRIWV